MSDIPISKIIRIDEPEQYKFHAARWNGEDHPLDAYVRDKDEWLGWNTWRNEKDEFTRKYIFSLIDFYPESEMWLFGGIYEVIKRNNIPQSHSYVIKEINEYTSYVGRLKIKLQKPNRGRAFYLEHHLNNMKVSEILKVPYSGEVFPGYEKLNHDFKLLCPIFKNKNSGWMSALMNIKGIYVIMDKSNGMKYIGSAYGDSGIWSRWSNYFESGHGGNDELAKLIYKEGYNYAIENFRFSLLEYRPMKADDKVIIERENFWKEVFLSRGKFGYNQN